MTSRPGWQYCRARKRRLLAFAIDGATLRDNKGLVTRYTCGSAASANLGYSHAATRKA